MSAQEAVSLRKKGVIWNMLGSAMFGASSMLLTMLVSRVSGTEQAGVFSVCFSTAQLLYMAGLFGANHFQMTDYQARYPFSAYRGLKAFSTVLMLALGAVMALVLRFDMQRILLTALLTLYKLGSSVGELYQSLMFQRDRLDLSGQSVFFRTLFATVAFAAVILTSGSVYWAAFALIATNALGLWLWGARPAQAFIGPHEKTDWRQTRTLALDCLPLFASVLLMDFILVCPKYAVDAYLSDAVLGAYSMIAMPIQIINLLCSFLFRPALKTVSDTVRAKDFKRLSGILGKMALVVLALTVFTGGACWWMGPEALGWFYGADLLAYRLPLLGVIAGSGVFAYSHLLYYVLLVIREQKRLLVNYAATTVLALICAYAGTYLWGIAGAILSFAVTHLVVNVIHGIALYRTLKHEKKEED